MYLIKLDVNKLKHRNKMDLLLKRSKEILDKDLIWYGDIKTCTEDMEEEGLAFIMGHNEDGTVIFKEDIVFVTLDAKGKDGLISYITLEDFNKLDISHKFTMKEF